MSDDLAPNYIIEIAGQELKSDVTQFIKRVEYESADGMIDQAKIVASNPNYLLSSARVFAPGNEMEIYMGYGAARVRLIGRVVLLKPMPRFPKDGMPVLEITGYTKSYLMKEQRPETGPLPSPWAKKKKKKKSQSNTVWKKVAVDEVVQEKALAHYLAEDIDRVPGPARNVIQPARMSDYEFLQGLANMTGFSFWVDYSFDTGWTLHFKDLTKGLDSQEFQYTFRHGQGDRTTLLSFEPEMIFKDHFTQIRVQGHIINDSGRSELVDIVISEEKETEADLDYAGTLETLEVDPESAAAVKIFIGDYSFAVIPKIEFRNRHAMENWASQWYRRMREHFIAGEGVVPGVETLFARQTHILEGLQPPYDGKYYFSKVRHVIDSGSGYYCEFNARKVLQ